MKHLACLFAVLSLFAASGCSTLRCPAKPAKPVIAKNYLDKGFTPWMTLSELKAYFEPLDAKDEAGKNYWDHKHWMTAVQGRWDDGGPQFRFKLSSAPADRRYGWYWYYNMDAAAFHSRLSDFADKHFKLVYHDVYTWPDGSKHYSGIWQQFYAPKELQQQQPAPSHSNVPAGVSQQEIQWALQLEQRVKTENYQPTPQETGQYQELARRLSSAQSQQSNPSP